MPIALAVAILSTGLLFLIIARWRRNRLILILVAVLAVVSWLIVGAIWVSGQWTFSFSLNLPNFKFFIYALVLSAFLVWLAGLGGETCRRTIAWVIGVAWLAAGIGWWASGWLGILAITMPSMIMLVAGLLALPPFVVPTELLTWTLPGFTRSSSEQGGTRIARWKVSTTLGMAFTLLWLVGLGSGWLQMDALAFWIYLQGLLLIFRPALPLERGRWYVPFYLCIAYGFLVVSIWRLFHGFALDDPLHLLVLVQGLSVIASYTVPLAGKTKWVAWVGMSGLYGSGFLFAVMIGPIERTPTNFFIWVVGIIALLRFAIPDKDQAGQWASPTYQLVEERPRSLRARVIRRRLKGQSLSVKNVEGVLKGYVDWLTVWVTAFLITSYGLAWIEGILSAAFGGAWLNGWVFAIGLVAALMPLYITPSANWKAFKALITFNLGRNVPYYTVIGGAGESGQLVERPGGLSAGGRLAGPGLALSRADHALLLHDGAGTKPERVSPPGYHFVEPFVKVREAVDLRHQLRSKPTVSAKTKDGIDVNVDAFVPFRIAVERAVAVTPKARRAILANHDGSLQLWNLEKQTVALSRTQARAAAVTPDGRCVVAINPGGTVGVWYLDWDQSRLAMHNLRHLDGLSNASAVDVTADGNRFVIGHSDGRLDVWDLQPPSLQGGLVGHAASVCAIAVAPDGNRIFSASTDGALRVSDPSGAGYRERTLGGEHAGVCAVVVTPDGRHGISGSREGTLKVWDLDRLKEERTLVGRREGLRALAITSDGCHIAFISAYGKLRLWDLRTGLEGRLVDSSDAWSHALAMTPDGGHIVLAGPEDGLQVCSTWHVARTLQGHVDWVRAIAMTPDARRAVSTSSDGTLKVWDLEEQQVMLSLDGHARARAVAISRRGNDVVVGYSDGGLKALKLRNGPGPAAVSVENERNLVGHRDWVCAVAVTPDGRRAVSVASSESALAFSPGALELKVWDLHFGNEVQRLPVEENWVHAMTVTSTGSHALLAVPDGSIKGLDLGIAEGQTYVLDGPPDDRQRDVRAMTVDPTDDSRLVLVCSDGLIEEFELQRDSDTGELRLKGARERKGAAEWRRNVRHPVLELGRSFPYDSEAVLRAVHAQQSPVDDGQHSGWQELAHQRCAAVLRDILASYNLDELSGLHDLDADPRGDIATKMRDEVRGQLRRWGLQLFGGGIGNLIPPERALRQRIEHWQAHLRKEIEMLEAEAEAEKLAMIERYRARAEKELIESISQAYDSLRDLDPERRQEVMAIRALASIERSMTTPQASASAAQMVLGRADADSDDRKSAGE